MRTVGFVTIGQSPRPDMMEEFERALPGLKLAQRGALDDLTEAEITALAPSPGDEVLVSRLRSGRPVRLAHRQIDGRVQVCLDRFAQEGVGLAVVLCTGAFPGLAFGGVLLRPHRVLPHVVAAVCEGLPANAPVRLGVMVPDEGQIRQAESRWSGRAAATVVAASPYGDSRTIAGAAQALEAAAVSLVVMDCLGYTREMQQTVARATGVPVVLATGAVALVVREVAGAGAAVPAGGA
ncbi:MAG TPA: AroM family protein [bacterium]|nr:AroM family protein [bacterium]